MLRPARPSAPASNRKRVNKTQIFRLSAALLLPIAFACKGKTDSAPNAMADTGKSMQGMAGMSGMDAPVTIPPGAVYTAADVHFMQGMIAHHAQAIYMSRLAKTRTLDGHLLKLAEKIDQSQRAEIKLMQDWLIAHNQTAPDTNSYKTVMMKGMLNAAQLKELEDTKGDPFNKAYLTYMIQHHQGALAMVDDLLASPLAAQDVDVSVFANDVQVVQSAEIAKMQQLLADL